MNVDGAIGHHEGSTIMTGIESDLGKRLRREKGGMSRAGAMGVIALMLGACGGDAGETGDLAVADGRALYEENCMMCHGPGAEGDGPMAASLPARPPRLMDHLGHHTEAEFIRLIQGGVPPAMPPTGLSEGQVRLVVDYLWTLVPEAEVAALREMQRQMEAMGDAGSGAMPGMDGMDHSQHMMEMDHSEHMMEMDSAHAPASGGAGAGGR
jgi:mono/diheme cytochrome c family protein